MKMSMEHQTPIPVESEASEVLNERQPTVFEESTAQLLTMLDEAPNRPVNPRFFHAGWDRREPDRLVSLTTMTARPTGARKQELYGEFYQAQFEVTYCDQNGVESHDFIWAETGAQRRGNPIKPNRDAFVRDYDYRPLNGGDVAKTLLDHVKNMDDCISLLRSLKGRDGISAAEPYIANLVNTFTGNFAYRGFASLKKGDVTENVHKLFELICEAQNFGQSVPKSTQSFLVSRLLRTVVDRNLQAEFDHLSPQEALDILGSALDQGVITNPHSKQRAFGYAPIYSYPSAVERLHEYLEDPDHNKGPKNVAGVERRTFTTGFVLARLRAEPAITEQLDGVKLSPVFIAGRAANDHAILTSMLSSVILSLNADERVLSSRSSTIASTFAYALELLHPNADEEQRVFDQKCIDIVRQALNPVITRKVGQKALQGKDVTLLDDDERESW